MGRKAHSVVSGSWLVDRRTANREPRITNGRNLLRVRSGHVLVEFAIAMPLLLLMTMGVMQVSLLAAAKAVVNHAAFVAARAELVGEDPEEAAEMVCAPLAGTASDQPPGTYADYVIPGYGAVPRSGISREKTSASVVHPGSAGSAAVRVDVTHDFELIFPFVAELFRTDGAEHGGKPHARIVETCTLARRWE